MNKARIMDAAHWFLRLALAAGFLSAVADRFGMWGPPGAPNVAWGTWQPFVEYVAKLNWFAPKHAIPSRLGRDLRRALGCLRPTHWVAVAVVRSCGWLAPVIVRCHHDDGARDQGSIRFLRVRSRRWSVSPRGGL